MTISSHRGLRHGDTRRPVAGHGTVLRRAFAIREWRMEAA